ncbi:MAG: ABC transporter permease [Chloroflexi bacterium]|nr:ABC transporter permease [Chloroflexota bacterium]
MKPSLRTIRHKIIRDLRGNLGRTLLVSLSIGIGVLAVGTIVAAKDILTCDIHTRYSAINPAQIALTVSEGVTRDDLAGLRRLPGAASVQGRAIVDGRYHTATSPEWKTIEFIGIPEPDAQSVDVVTPQAGQWYADRGELVVERASLVVMNAQIGDSVIVDAMGHEKGLRIVGTAHQQDDVMASVKGNPIAFVNSDTLLQLQGNERYNTVYLTVADPARKSAVADAARKRLEDSGLTVTRVTLLDPAQHPAQDVLDVLLLVMGILAVLALGLSSFLVTNTIGALVAQQIKQIGIMKSIGADTRTVVRVYGLAVLAYALLGTAAAAPVAERAGYRLAQFLAGQINVDLLPYRPSVPAGLAMLGVGLVVPFVASAKPLREGARITVRQAIADYGLGGGSGDNRLSRLLGRIGSLPRVWALALRNAVRVPDRLALSLVTLTLGGATFIAVLSVDASFASTIDNLVEGQYGMHTLLAFTHEQRSSWVDSLAESESGVARAEPWFFDHATMKVPAGQEVQVLVEAGPDDTQFYTPRLEAGRWLTSEDEQAIVINRKWAEEEHVNLGDTVHLEFGENHTDTEWVVVGINQDLVQRQTGVFVPLDALEHQLKRTDKTTVLEVRYHSDDVRTRSRSTADLVAFFKAQGIDVFSTQSLTDIKSQITSLYHILVVFLLSMSLLMALVGGIGLMGMMSINVLERSKEIGVMRAIGAASRDIVEIFWGEAMVVSGLSFVLAVLASVPLSQVMARAVGIAFIQSPLDFAYAYRGIAYWFAITAVVGTLASIVPALNAANLSVRQSLSYE